MAQEYEESEFEGPVNEHLHCVICHSVLRDPVQCRTNEHKFCRRCITTHLQDSQQCPTCEDPLTPETLGNVHPSLPKTLATCERNPISDSNNDTKRKHCHKQNHEHEVCDCQRINCDHCGNTMSHKDSSEYPCPKEEICELKSDLDKFRSYVREEIVTGMRKLTSAVSRIEGTLIQSNGNSSPESRAEIVVVGGEGIKSTIVLNVASGKWRCLAATYECEGTSSVLYKNHMYVAGGSIGHLTDIVKQLDLSQHNAQWIVSQFQLPFVSRGHTTVLCQNSLYVVGGLTDSRDLALDTIHEIPLIPPCKPQLLCKLPEAKCYHGATVVNDKMYITGGCKQYANTATDDVIEYDLASKACKLLKPLPYAVSGMDTARWQNKILVVGGLNRKGNYLDSVVMYDVNNQRHHSLPKMQKKRAYCTAVVVGNKLIVMGGADERSSRISSVESYDFQTYTWSDMAPMDEPRAYATAVVNYY